MYQHYFQCQNWLGLELITASKQTFCVVFGVEVQMRYLREVSKDLQLHAAENQAQGT